MSQINTVSSKIELCERCNGDGWHYSSDLTAGSDVSFKNHSTLKEVNCSICHGTGRLIRFQTVEFKPFTQISFSDNVTPLFKDKE